MSTISDAFLPQKRTLASEELRVRLKRVFSRSILLAIILTVGYFILPLMQSFGIFIPVMNLPLITAASIMLLAIVGVLLYSIFGDIIAILDPRSKLTKVLLKGLASDHVTLAKRAAYDLLIMVVLLIIAVALIPILNSIPGIGTYLATALPFLVLAIVVFVFWDLGKIFLREIERLVDFIAEKIEEAEKKNHR